MKVNKINGQSANCHSEVFRGILFLYNDQNVGIPRSEDFAWNDSGKKAFYAYERYPNVKFT